MVLFNYKLFKILLTVFILLSVVFVLFLFPKNAGAQIVPVHDAPNATINSTTAGNTGATVGNTAVSAGADAALTKKEFILDAILKILSQTLISQLTQSTVNWINSGFDGSPAFISNPGKFLQGVGDSVAGQFIEELGFGILCEPFKLDLRLSLALEYGGGGSHDLGCTLSDVIGNVEGFLEGDFVNQGGWDQWINITQKPNNNKYGAYINARSALDWRISHAEGEEQRKLNWAEGFLSHEECVDDSYYFFYETKAEALAVCEKKIVTPGTTINNHLGNVLGSEFRQLELADEINEIIGALVGQLMTQVMSASGLAGTNSSDYQGGSGHRVSEAKIRGEIEYASQIQNAQALSDQTIGEVPVTTNPCLDTQNCNTPTTNTGTTPLSAGFNLALSRNGSAPASQSSTYENATNREAGKANDGLINNTVAITNAEIKPWWQVDLGSGENISKILISRRFNAVTYEQTLGEFKVFVSKTPFDINFDPENPPAGVWVSDLQNRDTGGQTQSIDIGTQGRYVRIQRMENSPKSLQLVEVQVIRNEIPRIDISSSELNNKIEINAGEFNKPEFELARDRRLIGGVTVRDPEDGDGTIQPTIDISFVNTRVPGTYTITYRATDSGGAQALPVTRSITIKNTPPRIIPIGSLSVQIPLNNSTYLDPGVTVVDSEDERPIQYTTIITRYGVTVQQIVPSFGGELFRINYYATDSHGASAETVTKYVSVI